MNIGLIGLGTSHVGIFTKLLNENYENNHLRNAKITVGCPSNPERSKEKISRIIKL